MKEEPTPRMYGVLGKIQEDPDCCVAKLDDLQCSWERGNGSDGLYCWYHAKKSIKSHKIKTAATISTAHRYSEP